ncbi:DUF3135 domain-containing protein [candidate division KSB1 bacterium]
MSEDETPVLVDGKTFEEMVAFFKRDPERFEEWRLGALQDEISKSPPSTQARLQSVLNGFEIRMSRFGSGLARYNAVVAEFLGNTFPTLDDALQGKTVPTEVKRNNVVPLFKK